MLSVCHKLGGAALLTWAAFLALAFAAALPRLNHEAFIIPDGASNAHYWSLGVDPDFQVYPLFNGPNLDTISLLMSAVQLLTREALEDIDGDVPRIFWHSQDPRFASVGIFVIPPAQSGTVNRRMMVWGLQRSLQYMMNRNRFASVKFRMMRGDYEVGSIEYASLSQESQISRVVEHAPSHKHQVESSIPGTASTPIIAFDSLSDHGGNMSWLNGLGLQVYCRPFGYDLEPFDVFTPVVAMIAYMAQSPSREHVGSRITVFIPGQTIIKFTDQNRQSPPFFENQHLLKSTAILPAFMFNKGRFSEVDARVMVDGALVAIAKLNIARTPHPHLQLNASESEP